MWLTLPAHVDAHAVLVAARKRGVSFKPGDLFSSKEGSRAFRNHCCIVVAHYPEETLTRGLSILCDVVRDLKGASALGETADGGLFEIWRREFGAPGSPRFEAARRNFIVSHAG